ncbi:MAG: DUF4170 domain-containing protein [Alphaproteobacteria bacterium]|jgi:hypothetical protein
MSQANMRYWIVGGEYEDAGFERLVTGTEKLVGPFADKSNAEQAWREMSVATRSSCHTRFTIAEERAR